MNKNKDLNKNKTHKLNYKFQQKIPVQNKALPENNANLLIIINYINIL